MSDDGRRQIVLELFVDTAHVPHSGHATVKAGEADFTAALAAGKEIEYTEVPQVDLGMGDRPPDFILGFRIERFISVKGKYPVAFAVFEAVVPGRGKVIAPLEWVHLGAEGAGDPRCSIKGASIHDHDFIRDTADRLETVFDELRLVFRDEVQADGGPGGFASGSLLSEGCLSGHYRKDRRGGRKCIAVRSTARSPESCVGIRYIL